MEAWISSVFILMILLVHVRTGSVRHGLLVLGSHNGSDLIMDMDMWPAQPILAESYCRLMLFKLQSSECPFLRLLFHILIALPVYNLMLIVICWQLNRSASHHAERIVLVLQPITAAYPLDLPAVVNPTMPPPLPPPRCRRRQAPKPPPRIVRHQQNFASAGYPSQKDPFAPMHGFHNPDQYKVLRRNLKRVLEGLQQPVPETTIPSLPLPLCLTEDSAPSSSTILSLDMPKKKTKSRKIFNTLFKRLTKVFAKKRKANKSSTKNADRDSNRSGIFYPIWQGIKTRSKRKVDAKSLPLSSTESISTNSSSQWLYSC